MDEHIAYMETAIQLALAQPRAPFAALLVDHKSGATVATGLNDTRRNPLRHGEIDCIENALISLGKPNWSNLRLYTTAEPCCMCQSAILWCGIREVIFGTSVSTLRKLGWNQFDMTAQDVIDKTPFAQCSVIGGVSESRCDALFTIAAELKGLTK
ncbi:MAG: nucleoside deaminase [Planctomycetaceae bacterium]